jgi:hypothetical protein
VHLRAGYEDYHASGHLANQVPQTEAQPHSDCLCRAIGGTANKANESKIARGKPAIAHHCAQRRSSQNSLGASGWIACELPGTEAARSRCAPLGRQAVAKELFQRLRLDRVRVRHHAPDVAQVAVMLHRAHVEARLLAELRDAGAVVVAEGAAAEDRVGDLGLEEQVDLDDLRLQRRGQGVRSVPFRRCTRGLLPAAGSITSGVTVVQLSTCTASTLQL